MKHSATPIHGGRYHVVNGETVPMSEQDTNEHSELHGNKPAPEAASDETKAAPAKGKAGSHKHG